MRERRKHFLVNKPLQFRYMAYISGTLFAVSLVIIINLYFGIWGNILDAFSNEEIRNNLLTASRIVEYEKARITSKGGEAPLAFFKQAEKLSRHQQEVFRDILNETNRKLTLQFLALLILIAWASIYLTHKIAGPMYRFHIALSTLSQGNLTTRIRLRRGDEGQDVAGQFNRTAESFDHFVCRLKNIARENKSDPQRMAEHLNAELSKIKSSVDI